jgi:serine protease AprX
MQSNGLLTVRSLSLALVLCAGSAMSVAADQSSGPAVTVSRARGVARLSLGGQVFHSTAATVVNVRQVGVPGTPTVVTLWGERQADGSVRSMYAISLNGLTVDIVRQADYVIGLQYAHLAAGAGNELYLVQYVVPPLPSMQERVAAAGGTIEIYAPQYAQVVRMSPEAAQQVAALPFVRWVGAYHPAYRVAPEIFGTVANANPEGVAARYSIGTLRRGPGQQQALAALVTALGGQVDVLTPDQFRMEATLTPSQLLAVIARNEVNFVEPWLGPGGTDMDLIRQQGGAVPTLSTAGFLGQGVRGEIHDTEVFATHQQWNGQVPLVHGVNGNSGTHGSSCYGINFATGTGNAQATGLCPQREQGIFYWYTQSTQFGGAQTRLAANTEAVNPSGPYRSTYQTSSVGSPQITTYSSISQETDDYLFLVDYLSCQSQSNTGNQNSRPQAWAKNIVAVGGTNLQETLIWTDDTFPGASFGPASDGRVKPDVCHSYQNIFTTTAGATSYTQFSGTSGATPITAGHFGLIMQMWHQQVWPGFGGGSSVFASRPKSTTAKALLINQAVPYNWLAGGNNATLTRFRQGWGVAHVGNLYNIRAKTFIVNESDVLAPLAVKAYNLTVNAGEPALRATLVYIDTKGNPAVQTQHRVNNLDLRVTAPDGTIYWGNNGLAAALWSPAGGVPNTKDTVENVFVQNPMAGTWTVEVIGAEIIQDTHVETPAIDADYALVVSGVVVPAS